jgi:AcrR family transcriptional regulator
MANVMSIAKPATRRKNPAERQAEIVETASRIAVSEGLERVTAKRVAAELGVVPGLVNHYFAAVDDLVAASFGFAAEAERAQIYGAAWLARRPQDQLRRLLAELLDPARDAVSLLWLDAWQGSRRRPALLREVVAQMEADAGELARMIQGGVDASEFHVEDAREAALGIMALIDGLSVQAATRTQIDYASVSRLVIRTTEAELGLAAGSLGPPTAS